MKSEIHDHPESYRAASRPDAMPVTVTTVSPNEYAEPRWVRQLGAWLRLVWTGRAQPNDAR